MKKIIGSLISILLIGSTAFASTYAFKRPEGGVSIITITEPSTTIEKELEKQGMAGSEYVKDPSLPSQPQEFWDISNGEVILTKSESEIAQIISDRQKKIEADALIAARQKQIAIESLKTDGLMDTEGYLTDSGQTEANTIKRNL